MCKVIVGDCLFFPYLRFSAGVELYKPASEWYLPSFASACGETLLHRQKALDYPCSSKLVVACNRRLSPVILIHGITTTIVVSFEIKLVTASKLAYPAFISNCRGSSSPGSASGKRHFLRQLTRAGYAF